MVHDALSIVIVNWNTRELLAQCLTSILAQVEPTQTEIWVVDNASSDHSVELLRDRFPSVKFISSRVNLGFAAANNLALRRAHGKFILLLNPDTIVGPGAIARLADFLDAHADVGAVAPRLVNPDGSLQVSCEPFPTLFREFWRLFHLDRWRRFASYAPTRWMQSTPQRVDVARGACLMVRRSVFEQLGWFDEQFFMYSEEVDLCRRLACAGYAVVWLPDAQVMHLGAQSTRQVEDAMFFQLYKGKIQYFRKHYGTVAAWIYRAILFVAAAARLILSPLAYLERAPKRTMHLRLARLYGRLILDLRTL